MAAILRLYPDSAGSSVEPIIVTCSSEFDPLLGYGFNGSRATVQFLFCPWSVNSNLHEKQECLFRFILVRLLFSFGCNLIW